MFSLRTFARAGPRATSRLTATAARRSAFSSTQLQSAVRIQLPRASAKAFSTSRPRFDAQAQELAAKLEQELQMEIENGDEADAESGKHDSVLIGEREWDLTDNEGEQFVTFTRKYEDETVSVRFSIADFPAPYSEEDADEALLDEEDFDAQSGGANTKGAVNQGRTSGGNVKIAPEDSVAPADRDELRDSEDDGGAPQEPFAVNVAVTVRRGNKPSALRIDLVAEDGDFSVQSIAHSQSAVTDAFDPGFQTGAEKHYSGPPFQQLDEELQNMFENYLTERGIDTALAVYIPNYIDAKEQREYLAWLKRVKEFVE